MIRMQRFVPLPPTWITFVIPWVVSLASEAGGGVAAACEHFITTVVT